MWRFTRVIYIPLHGLWCFNFLKIKVKSEKTGLFHLYEIRVIWTYKSGYLGVFSGIRVIWAYKSGYFKATK